MQHSLLSPSELPKAIPKPQAPRWRELDELFPCSSECRAYLKKRRHRKPRKNQ